MNKDYTINLKKRKKLNWKNSLVVIAAVVLTTVGIKAADQFGGKSAAEQASESSACPSDMAFVPSASGGFCVDKYEASAGSGCPYADPGGQLETGQNLNAKDCQPISEGGRRPWRNISQNQAALACAKAGKRLPTGKEWQQAALGTPDKKEGWTPDDCQVDKNWSEAPGMTGSAKDCVSGAGAFDMIGNIWEWIDGSINDGVYEGRELPESGYIAGVDDQAMPSETRKDAGDEVYYHDFFWLKKKDVRAIARGGYWENGADAGQYAVYAVPEPSFVGIGIGFRCAK